jgi:predicted MFS family arabinose efflux permease
MDVEATIAPWTLYSERQRLGLLVILFAVTTSNYFDYYIISILLEPIKLEFEVSDTMLGLLSGFFFTFLYAITSMPIARWSDRGSRRLVITLALTGWSVMTIVCGCAQSFWQLAIARLGVGAMEPGAVPPAQSLVADYFPPDRRATASAILNAGSAAGYLLAIGLGGVVAATHGWRVAFLLAGAPGLILAAIVWMGLSEPREHLVLVVEDPGSEGLLEALGRLWRKRTFRYVVIATSIYTVFAFGVGIFVPSFMMRTLHATMEQVSITWGVAISVANLIGALLGGRLSDRLSKGDVRWCAWLPALTCALAAPAYWFALSCTSLWTFVTADFFSELILATGISVSFVAVHAVCGSVRRTTAIAIMQMSFMLVGCGCGPLVTGVLSDALIPIYGSQSLQYSLIIMVVFLVPASAGYYLAGRAIRQELEP